MSDEYRYRSACDDGVNGAVEQYLAAGGDPDAADGTGWTGLIWAAWEGHLDIVRAVLRAGGDPDRQSSGGSTALIYAAYYGHEAVAEELLRGGADPSIKDKNGRTALAVAQRWNYGRVVALLNAYEARQRAAEAARQCGLEDKALPAGTRIRVEGLGVGTYEGWKGHWVGDNDHFVRFPSGVQKLQLRKLGPQAWAVVTDD